MALVITSQHLAESGEPEGLQPPTGVGVPLNPARLDLPRVLRALSTLLGIPRACSLHPPPATGVPFDDGKRPLQPLRHVPETSLRRWRFTVEDEAGEGCSRLPRLGIPGLRPEAAGPPAQGRLNLGHSPAPFLWQQDRPGTGSQVRGRGVHPCVNSPDTVSPA